MKKDEYIERYDEAAWEKKLAQTRAWHKAHPEKSKAYYKEWREEHLEEEKARIKAWRDAHPEHVKANQHETNRKGGKHYDKMLVAQRTGLPGEKNKIRAKHCRKYKPFKDIIAPDSQIHHEWIPKTAEYNGLALVEKDQHIFGYVDVIQILEGTITLLTEEKVRNGKKKKNDTI